MLFVREMFSGDLQKDIVSYLDTFEAMLILQLYRIPPPLMARVLGKGISLTVRDTSSGIEDGTRDGNDDSQTFLLRYYQLGDLARAGLEDPLEIHQGQKPFLTVCFKATGEFLLIQGIIPRTDLRLLPHSRP